jgi:hypothetical protein
LSYGVQGRPVVTLIEASTPEVAFPAGVDVAALGEIGLRLLGLSRTEAYRIAQTIDWRNTLLVPVPVSAASFRQVNIQGETALMIEANNSPRPNKAGMGGETVLMWSQQGVVYALTSQMGPDTLIDIAQSLQ